MNRDPQIQSYLDTVVAQIKFREAHAEVWQELESHIAELIDTGIDSGLSNDAAIENALRRMGNPIDVGQKLHLAHQPKFDWQLLGLGISVSLFYTFLTSYWTIFRSPALLLGLLIELSNGRSYIQLYFLSKFPLTILLSCAVAAVLMLWNYQQLRRYAGWIYGFVLLAIAVVIGLTVTYLGANALFNPAQVREYQFLYQGSDRLQNWSSIGLLATMVVQMFAPVLLIVGLAGILSRQLWSKPIAALRCIGLLVVPVIGLSAINCRYAVISFAIAAINLVIASKAKWWQIAMTVAVLFVSFACLYQSEIMAFQGVQIAPYCDPPYCDAHSFEQSVRFLIQTALWLILLALIWIRVMFLVRQLREPLARSLGIGLSTVLGAELLLNIVGTSGLGLFPIDFSDPMPMESFDTIYGTLTSFMMLRTVVAIALILSIHRRRTLITSRYT